MNLSRAAKAKFWDRKILRWEAARYSRGQNSVLERLRQATQILAPHVTGRRIVELGCGSGLLAQNLLPFSPASYLGIDISGTAIAAAQNRLRDHSQVFRFEVMDVHAAPPAEADIVVSLGLLDWLTDEEVRETLARFRAEHFLHSFSGDRLTPVSLLHRAMVFAQYGYRTKAYVPRYRNHRKILALLPAPQSERARFHRHPRLSFGEMVLHQEIAT